MESFFAAIRKKKETEDLETSGEMFLIAGLGNPGREYRQSRHNFGFIVVDRLAEKTGTQFAKGQFKALTALSAFEGKRILLVKPQTYMNLSGTAVIPLLHYYKIPEERLLVIHDDMDLPFGTLRIRPSGGNAGQKGLGSIIEQLGNQNFARLRCGIGHPQGQMEVKDYVLNKFSREETELLPSVTDKASEAVLDYLRAGLQYAMNHYNGSVEG